MTEEITKAEDKLEDVTQELEQVRGAVWAFLDHQDIHEPGPILKDGNWHYGPCVEGGPRMEDLYPNGFQFCADEDCGEYWPCSVEELRRAVFPRTAQLGSQEQKSDDMETT